MGAESFSEPAFSEAGFCESGAAEAGCAEVSCEDLCVEPGGEESVCGGSCERSNSLLIAMIAAGRTTVAAAGEVSAQNPRITARYMFNKV